MYSRGDDYDDGGCIGKYTDDGGGGVYSRGGDYGDGGCIGWYSESDVLYSDANSTVFIQI